MPKYTVEDVKAITMENLNRIGNSVDEWADFLLKAAYFYKYSFADQIVIAAIKPEATAIADFDTWSKKLNARIKRGAEGTPLLREKNGQQVVSYFYNITDTDSTHQLWQMPMNNSEFNAKLAKAFKYGDNNKSAEEVLQSQIINKSFYLAEEICSENSSVKKYGLDNFIFCSISNMLFKRCGFEPLYGGNDFDYLNSISDEQLMYIGAKLAESVKELIVTVEKASITFKKEKEAKEKEESLQSHTRQPRRYSLEPDKIGERLWNGKTVDEFTEQDIAAFMAETEAALSETNSENSAQIEHNNLNEQQEQPKQSNIIGNIPYRYISQKTYRKLEKNLALKVADELENADVKYSGRINDDDTVTLTVSRNDISTLEAVIGQIKKAAPKKLRFSEVQIEEAKRTSLVDFLTSRGEKLKKVGSNEYTMEAHDSMRINENRFYWNSQGKYGNAVTFCMEYYGLEFTAAVAELLRFKGYNLDYGEEIVYTQPAQQPLAVEPQEELELKPLPYDLADNARRAYAYLTKTRMLNEDVVNRLIKNGSIAQDIKGNAVFKIFDNNNQLSGAEIIGTTTDKRYKQVTERGGNSFIFNPTGKAKPEKAIFFEAAIDALSYYCLNENTDALLVSMAGLKDMMVLNIVERYGLKPEQVYISTDYDKWGENFAVKMQEKHGFKAYRVCDDVRFKNHPDIKDWNDLLRAEKAAPQKDITQEEKSFAQQVDDSLNGKIPFYSALKVCDTPQILLEVGCEQLPMLYTQRHLRNALNADSSKEHFHGLNIEQIKILPQLIETPVMIYDSLSRNDSLVVVTSELDSNSLPIIASIKPNGKGRYELETIETNFITSVHGRENFINQVTKVLEQDKMLFCDKQKSQEMFERWGLQLSELTNTLDFNIIIHKSNNIVNSKTTQNSNISTENQPVEINSISSITPDDNGIIGNTAYRYVPKKTYRKFDKEVGLKIAQVLDNEKIKFSGKTTEDTITLTIDGNSIDKAEVIIKGIKDVANEETKEPQNIAEDISTTPTEEVSGIPQDIVVTALKRGSGFEYGKFRIENFYSTIENKAERAAAIKKEYGAGGVFGLSENVGELAGYETNAKGLIVEWNSEFGRQNSILKWNNIEKELGELIKSDNYITPEERQKYDRHNFVEAQLQLLQEGDLISVNGDTYTVVDNTPYRALQVIPHNFDSNIHYSNENPTGEKSYFIDSYILERNDFQIVDTEKTLSDLVLANMPDDTVSISEMNDFGYEGNDMLPISEETALRYFDNNDFSVYLLYEDSTEGQALTREDIVSHKGMYGIETAEWESYITPLLNAAKQVAEEQGLPFSNRFSEGADEVTNPYIYDGTMSLEDFREAQKAESAEKASLQYHIYQVKSGEEYRNVRFIGLQALNSLGEKVDISNYNLVYSGSLNDIEGATLENKLDTIFYKFNQQRPDDFEGHSLSVSDVITLESENEAAAYYVDSFGFSNIPDFFKDKSIEDAKEAPSSDIESAKEKYFMECDISSIMAKSTLAWDEIESLGYIFYEKGYITKYPYSEKSLYGNGLTEQEAYTLSERMQKGEDISKELALSLLGNAKNGVIDYEGDILGIEFSKELTETGLLLTYNNSQREVSFRELADSYLSYFKNEYDDITQEQEQPEEIINAPSDNVDTKNYAQIEQKIENYKIKALDYGTDREKCRNNIEAIKTLKAIEDENRTATPEEQEILSRYVGWGGLADVFDESKSAWTKEYAELKELLTDSEYTSARASTLNAHYTSPIIISAMYKALSNMGFSSGKILEPSMGIGNFFGMLPEAMSNSKLYGVELDDISGRIAKQLYPKAHIQVKGFEKTDFTSNTFDVAIGNVPFGDIPIYDKEFKGSNLIHDYFFKKALDKVRQGGIVAFITSKGTLDKANSTVRRYLAERAELLGAVRLPNNAFKKNAGTEVTSDIIFLKKRNMPITLDDSNLPEWINLSKDSTGIEMNNYFVQHPEMVCGTMTEVSGRFGMETTCKPFDNADLSALIDTAISNINGSIGEGYAEVEVSEENSNINADIIPENYRNYCYTVIDNDIYYREGNNMVLQQFNKNKTTRIKGMIEISEALRELINSQKENYTDEYIKAQQEKLNTLYDRFTASYGLLSSHNNKSIFRFDDTAALLLSLENIDENGNLLSKADIFTKRTIYPYQPITSVNTSSEALTVSISERAGVDLAFMSELCSKSEEEIIKDLEGVIFENPLTEKYETSDEYLSGNVREKLATARTYAKKDEKYTINVTALEQVQPEPLKPNEISVQLGSTWVPVQYFEQFMYELLNTPERCRSNFRWRSGNPFASSGDADNQTITVAYDENTATYGISNKSSYSADKGNVRASQTYGTGRMNAYTIIENTLNQKPVKIFDYVEDEKGTKRAVLNDKETLLAQDKQNSIKQAFQDWIFADAERTEDLCRIYNEKFNSLRPREYDGSHITFGGINPEIGLLKHQKDAIAHTLYGGNTLLAHTVGAGKTFEMVASAMESKRLGLCTKSLICVPKAIVGQTAREFLQLYPTANILVPDEKDFSKANRERFCSRIATGNYDAVIISHTQLEKIPLSAERQIDFVQGQIDEITNSLENLKFKSYEKGFTVKQLEATKKTLTAKLEKLNNNDKRDTTITFEELGIDKLYVDEAHLFKNRFFTTKMGRNVSGINASSASQRAEDLAMKCRYLDEITGSKGVVFATGTPISNSMTELYTMQNYLQHDVMASRGLSHFDAWASCFGETKLSLELAPEGKGYQMKTRFARFFNLPELMNMFKEIADIKTADVLKLPVPEAAYHTVTAEPSEYQKDMVDGLAQRAKAIRDKQVSADVDNMLNVTNDGRKLALDQRLLNELLPDYPHSKVNLCVDKVFEIWQDTAAQKSTQMIFCDLSTPDKSKFNVYDDIKSKLIKKGIPENEIAFIHSYNTDEQKQQLFSKVRKGNIRVLLGSTEKMGTGTNVQNKLIAAHHLDCPWRPSDLEQRNGRIIRQGNTNPQVDIYNYVTKGTFDAYLYQLVENKQKFISQIMTSKSPARSAEDVDESVLSYAQIKALASGDPKIKEKMDLEIEVSRLRTVYAGYQEERRVMQTNITQTYPERIQQLQERINGCKKDIEVANHTSQTDSFNPMKIHGKSYADKKEAGEALLAVRKLGLIGEYRGFNMYLSFNSLTKELNLTLSLNTAHTIELGKDALGNITRIDNAINGIGKELNTSELKLDKVLEQLAAAKEEVNKPFPQKEELAEKERRLEVLDKELTIDKAEPENAAPEQTHTDLTKRSTEPVL